MKSGRGSTLWMIVLLLTLSTTPGMCDKLSTTELWTLLDEAEVVIVELMEENAELQIELADSWTSCATLVEETAIEAVAVAVKPLLIEVAGLEAVVARGRWITVGVGLGALAVGVVLGIVICQ